MEKSNEKNRRLITATSWPSIHNYPPIGQLRALIFNSKSNGFERCIRRIGKRVLIDESEFFAWVDEQKFNQDNA